MALQKDSHQEIFCRKDSILRKKVNATDKGSDKTGKNQLKKKQVWYSNNFLTDISYSKMKKNYCLNGHFAINKFSRLPVLSESNLPAEKTHMSQRLCYFRLLIE